MPGRAIPPILEFVNKNLVTARYAERHIRPRDKDMSITTSASPRGGGKPRGTYAKTEQKRLTILDAALEVFAESGYRSGSLREVAAKVGMSEAGLLHHFPNKSSLLAAVLDHRDDHSAELINLSPEAGVESLRGLVALTQYNMTIPGVIELYCTLSAEATSAAHPAHQYFVNRYEYVRGIITRAFEVMESRGELREGVNPRVAARGTIALLDGLQVQWLLDPTSVDMAEDVRVYLDSLVIDKLSFA